MDIIIVVKKSTLTHAEMTKAHVQSVQVVSTKNIFI